MRGVVKAIRVIGFVALAGAAAFSCVGDWGPEHTGEAAGPITGSCSALQYNAPCDPDGNGPEMECGGICRPNVNGVMTCYSLSALAIPLSANDNRLCGSPILDNCMGSFCKAGVCVDSMATTASSGSVAQSVGVGPIDAGFPKGGVPDGTPCQPSASDGYCTGTCLDGACVFFNGCPYGQNICEFQTCAPDGTCKNNDLLQNTGCNDFDECTKSDVCDGFGSCVGGPPPNCDDADPCTDDMCISFIGCSNVNHCSCNNNAQCDDGNACTGVETCANGSCQPGAPLDCNDNDACTDDGCDGSTGCTHNATSCDDGNLCTNDGCDLQTGCTHTAMVCNDGNPCTDDTCDPQGGCPFPQIDCSDSNACTTDTCMNGNCMHVMACNDGDSCTVDTCDPQVGCGHAPANCDDGDSCTTDTCDAGTGCSNAYTCPCSNDAQCNDDNDCNGIETCDMNTSMCTTPPDLDCTDRDLCTVDFCSNNACTHEPMPCDDSDACTSDTCIDGLCNHTDISCNDSDDCTLDTCDHASGCQNIVMGSTNDAGTCEGAAAATGAGGATGAAGPSGSGGSDLGFIAQGNGCACRTGAPSPLDARALACLAAAFAAVANRRRARRRPSDRWAA